MAEIATAVPQENIANIPWAEMPYATVKKHIDARLGGAPPPPVEHRPKTPLDAFWYDVESYAFSKSQDMNLVDLEDLLNPLMKHDINKLLTMPGTPEQVLCQQFLAYSLSVVQLRAKASLNKQPFDRLVEAICRTPEVTVEPVKEDKSDANATVSNPETGGEGRPAAAPA